jgi:glycosyl transferase family 25
LTEQLFAPFGQVRIINLIDRPDRRREMLHQLGGVGGMAPNMSFYEARRPQSAGGFPSLGARGCFESHLAILREARDAGVASLAILEDDFDFSRSGRARAGGLISELFHQEWDLFYGAHLLAPDGRNGLVPIVADEPIMTASFVAVGGSALGPLVDFLDGVLSRPPGSPDYGPMHVDGAYTIFRQLHPERSTFAAFPPLGAQRSSPSDITPSDMFLDRWTPTSRLAGTLRRARNWLARM